MKRLTARGLAPQIEVFDRVVWRGVYARDPESNAIELVTHPAPLEAGR